MRVSAEHDNGVLFWNAFPAARLRVGASTHALVTDQLASRDFISSGVQEQIGPALLFEIFVRHRHGPDKFGPVLGISISYRENKFGPARKRIGRFVICVDA